MNAKKITIKKPHSLFSTSSGKLNPPSSIINNNPNVNIIRIPKNVFNNPHPQPPAELERKRTSLSRTSASPVITERDKKRIRLSDIPSHDPATSVPQRRTRRSSRILEEDLPNLLVPLTAADDEFSRPAKRSTTRKHSGNTDDFIGTDVKIKQEPIPITPLSALYKTKIRAKTLIESLTAEYEGELNAVEKENEEIKQYRALERLCQLFALKQTNRSVVQEKLPTPPSPPKQVVDEVLSEDDLVVVAVKEEKLDKQAASPSATVLSDKSNNSSCTSPKKDKPVIGSGETIEEEETQQAMEQLVKTTVEFEVDLSKLDDLLWGEICEVLKTF